MSFTSWELLPFNVFYSEEVLSLYKSKLGWTAAGSGLRLMGLHICDKMVDKENAETGEQE